MGCCCVTKKQPTFRIIKTENSQQQFTIKKPTLKCKSFYPIQYVCIDKNCPAETVFFCNSKLCIECLLNHSKCPFFRLDSLNELLQNKLTKYRNLINRITQSEEKMIEEIKKPRLDRIHTMLVSNLPKEYQEIIQYLYFQKTHHCDIERTEVAELLEKIKENTNVEVTEEEVLAKYDHNTKSILKSHQTNQDNIFYDNCLAPIKLPQVITTEVRKYGYSDITNYLAQMPESTKIVTITLLISNTGTVESTQEYQFDYIVRKLYLKQGKFVIIQWQRDFYSAQFIEKIVVTIFKLRVPILIAKKYKQQDLGYNHPYSGQIKPFAQELSNFINLEHLEISFYHPLLDQTYFKDFVNIVNHKLIKLKTLKLKVSAQTNKTIETNNWTTKINDRVAVQILKEDLKSSRVSN